MGYIGITGYILSIMGLYWDNGQENGNYWVLGLGYRESYGMWGSAGGIYEDAHDESINE